MTEWIYRRELVHAMPHISVSEVKSFQACARQWQLSYRERLERKHDTAGPSSLGRLVHSGLASALRAYFWAAVDGLDSEQQNLAAYGAAEDEIRTWDAKHRPELTSISVVGTDIQNVPVDQYGVQWSMMIDTALVLVNTTLDELNIPSNYTIVHVTDTDKNGEEVLVPLVEFELVAPIYDTEYAVRGVVDAVLRDKHTGYVEVVDWKTRKSFRRLEDEQMDMQLGIYQFMLNELWGVYAPIGTLYQIKSVLPKSPQFNKDGSINKRWRDYEWFRPLSLRRNARIQERLFDNLVRHGQRIASVDLTKEQPRAYNHTCGNCDFYNLCFAELHGHDVAGIREALYQKREERVENDEQETST